MPRICWPIFSSRSATSRKTRGLRNSFLAAAYELRTGIPQGETASSQLARCNPCDVD